MSPNTSRAPTMGTSGFHLKLAPAVMDFENMCAACRLPSAALAQPVELLALA